MFHLLMQAECYNGGVIDLYHDRPDLYDLLHDDEAHDLSFYAGLASTQSLHSGAALELGCGSGRVMATLLDEGLRVTGLDSEEAMLARAHRRLSAYGARARLVRGDMCDFDLGGARFEFILVAANTFMHLPDHAAQRACLAAIRAHLAPGGVAVLDLANPFHALALPQGALTLRKQARDDESGREVLVSGALEVDPAYPRLVDHLIFDEWWPDGIAHRLTSRVELRLVFMPELELLLAAAGLGIADAYGDYDLGPYHAASERMIAIVSY